MRHDGVEDEFTVAPLWLADKPVRSAVLPVILGCIAGLVLGAVVIVVSHVPLREAESPDFSVAVQ